MRARYLAALYLAAASCGASAQSFDVASITHNKIVGLPSSRLNCSDGGRFVSVDFSVQAIVQWAYDIQWFQFTGASPAWLADNRDAYNIDARAAGAVTQAQCKLMVQALLADRFKLKIHHEMKELPAYALRLGKNKPKLQEAGENDIVKWQGQPAIDENQAESKGWTMRTFAARLSGAPSLDQRPVVDQTGLTGTYKIDFVYAFMPTDNERPDVFTAVEGQLGLKLESTKVPVEMLVIDHIERPEEN